MGSPVDDDDEEDGVPRAWQRPASAWASPAAGAGPLRPGAVGAVAGVPAAAASVGQAGCGRGAMSAEVGMAAAGLGQVPGFHPGLLGLAGAQGMLGLQGLAGMSGVVPGLRGMGGTMPEGELGAGKERAAAGKGFGVLGGMAGMPGVMQMAMSPAAMQMGGMHLLQAWHGEGAPGMTAFGLDGLGAAAAAAAAAAAEAHGLMPGLVPGLGLEALGMMFPYGPVKGTEPAAGMERPSPYGPGAAAGAAGTSPCGGGGGCGSSAEAQQEQQQMQLPSPGQLCNLFIGNLGSSTSEADLRDLFAPCGQVTSVRVLVDPASGRSKGSGFVRFSTAEEAQSAIETFHGQRGMVVKIADSDVGKGRVRGRDNLYLTGLPGSDVDEPTLKRLFGDLGLTVVRTRVFPDTRGTGHCAAMVQVASQDQAAVAIQALHGRGKISCSYAVEKREDVALVVKYAGIDQSESDNLYISGLPTPQVDTLSLKKVFAAAGLTVMRSRLLPDTRDKGHSAALVQVATKEEAEKAIEVFGGQMAAAVGLKADQGGVPEGELPSHGNLFVGHLPEEVTEAELRQVFGCFGPIISCKVVMNHETGKSKGSGFVKFSEPEEAARAIAALNGQGGIVVRFADHDKGPKGKGKGDADESKEWSSSWWQGGQPAVRPRVIPGTVRAPNPLVLKFYPKEDEACCTLFMSGLPSPEGEAASLLQMFMSLGLKVGQIKMLPDLRGTGSSAALVTFSSEEEAAAAITSLNGQPPRAVGATLSAPPPEHRQSGEALALWRMMLTKKFSIQFKGDKGVVSDHVFLAGLSLNLDQFALQKMFGGLGLNLIWCKIYPDSKGWNSAALCQLASEEEGQLAVSVLSR